MRSNQNWYEWHFDSVPKPPRDFKKEARETIDGKSGDCKLHVRSYDEANSKDERPRGTTDGRSIVREPDVRSYGEASSKDEEASKTTDSRSVVRKVTVMPCDKISIKIGVAGYKFTTGPKWRPLAQLRTSDEASTAHKTASSIEQAGEGQKQWQNRLSTFEELVHESGLQIENCNRPFLVDDINSQHDPELWLILLHFRGRIDGIQGIVHIWRGFKQRSIQPEHSSVLSHELWNNFLRAGFEDHVVLSEMCEYIRSKYNEHGEATEGLYHNVVGHILRKKPQEAWAWHTLLKSYPPTSSEVLELFDLALTSRPARNVFPSIYAELPSTENFYSTILAKLCARELFTDAITWHRLLVRSGNLPLNTSALKPLLDNLALTGREELLAEIALDMANAGVAIDTNGSSPQQKDRINPRQYMNEAQSKFYDIKPKPLSDEFSARLLATTMFSVKTLINGLQMLGVDVIGPLALRTIAVRVIHDEACSPTEFLGHVHQLQEAGISTGTSKFSRLLGKVAREDNGQVLYDLVTSDQHPDVFEDRKVQESLLALYHRLGDQRQINRTLAILSLDGKHHSINADLWNVLFRRDLTLQDTPGLAYIAEGMHEKRIPLKRMSRTYMWNKMMTVRRPGRKPPNENSRTLIGIWQAAMRSGTFIPVGDWIELLRRLGMVGRFREYENLAIWLAKWYTDESFRKSQIGLAPQNEGAEISFQYSVPTNQLDPTHPFRILFPADMQHAVLAWGFTKREQINLIGMSASERIQSLTESECLSGLRMLARLRDIGVNFHTSQISRVCRIRIITVFAPKLSRPQKQQRLHRVDWNRTGHWDEYVLAMQTIWGPSLFASTSTSEDLVLQTRNVEEQLSDLGDRLTADARRSADKFRARAENEASKRNPGQRGHIPTEETAQDSLEPTED